MTTDDWTIADTDTATEILLYLGIATEASKEPFIDRRRDAIARIIRGRVDYEITQEREGCAFAAECHSGFGDWHTIETCAALIRARSDEPDDCVHVPKDVHARLISTPRLAVKPLEWTFFDRDEPYGYATSLLGTYVIAKNEEPEFAPPDRPWFSAELNEHFATPEAAKAAVQKHYEEQLFRSAFDNVPDTGA